MRFETTSKRIKQALLQAEMSAKELSEKTGVREASISQYVNGYHKPSNISAGKLGRALGVNPLWLMGFDEPMHKGKDALSAYPNLHPIGTRRLPVLSSIACGDPILRQEDQEFYIEVTTDIKADYALKAKGDSMANARIHDGDWVFIRSQTTVENGEIAAVAIDDEATLKRFYQYGDLIVLRPENPAYEEMQYRPEDGHEIKVLGKAVAFQSDVK